MPGVQFGAQADMNGFKVTEMAPGTAGTDAVNVNQLNAASPQGFAQTIGDAINSVYSVTHSFGTMDVMIQVYELAANHNVQVDAFRVDPNNVTVEFGGVIALNSHRVLVIPVP